MNIEQRYAVVWLGWDGTMEVSATFRWKWLATLFADFMLYFSATEWVTVVRPYCTDLGEALG